MGSFQYSASQSFESFSSCTTDDQDFREIGIVETPDLRSLERPAEALNTICWDSSPSIAISNALHSPIIDDDDVPKAIESRGCNKRNRSKGSNDYIRNQHHVIAERRRRDKLTQRLIALSALLPCLKKMDKASVLGEAVKYIKHLQDRVKNLEEKAKLQIIESAVLVKKKLLFNDESDEASMNKEAALFPEIEVRIKNKDLLLRVYCEKQRGLLGRILNEMEKFQMSINSSNSMPFGNNNLVITITAQMNENFTVTLKELVSKLRMVF